ncbi:hypothetical protein [Hufsiella ginkgonis]|uniref:PorV/PorQ family protein n=1 Tax=Hufsiella ginkgonis TaxID=2695274 RepID=A0A7K1XWZ6_9SPHI|nr:hypothetical protein [Hufsiella ginkgonis]MXV15533.1 hypothetical protein [Hufsiella ginkgonis]
MSKWYLFSVCAIGCAADLMGQSNAGARLCALGGSGVSVRDEWSLISNPAGLAAIRKAVLLVSSESILTDPVLSTQAAAILVPVKSYTTGIHIRSYGFAGYKEQRAGLAVGKRFGPKLLIGANFNYHQVAVTGYGTASAWSADWGVQYVLNKRYVFGAQVSNPARNSYVRELSSGIPVKIGFGGSCFFSDKVLVTSALQKTLDGETEWCYGLEYTPARWFALRGGVTTGSVHYSGGAGFQYRQFKIDTAAIIRSDLGNSSQISISYEF